MTKEALEIMVRLWTDPDPWEYRGTYWNVNSPEPYLAYGKHSSLPEAPSADRRRRPVAPQRDVAPGR